MAVIQISKIQVRRGLQENLPQLASGEFGWSVDKRRLWIGNGTLTEGAPEIGNTEILTEGTDIVAAVSSYNFKGEESGYTSQTGATLTSFVTRKLQDKIDEQISVRDFGATGDGVTDDTAAIQRAIDQIWPFGYSGTQGIRRRLHVPGGTYLISQTLVLPSYCYIMGDGPDSSVIKQTGIGPAIKLKDSLEQTGANLGDNGAQLPHSIKLVDLQLMTELAEDIVMLEACTDVDFHNVKFSGDNLTPVSFEDNKSCVLVTDTNDYVISAVKFYDCKFTRHTHGLKLRGNIQTVICISCDFDTLTYGVYTEDGSTAGVSPFGPSITTSVFDNIAYEAIYAETNSTTTSAFNVYKLVGHSDDTDMDSGAPVRHVLNWGNYNNFSISDVFERTQSNINISALITVSSAGTSSNVAQYNTTGTLQQGPGKTQTLVDNTSSFANTSLTMYGTTNAIVDYQITRGGNTRIGTMKVSSFQGVALYEDEYTESANVGVQFNFIQYDTDAYLNYTTSSTGVPGQFKYNVRTFI